MVLVRLETISYLLLPTWTGSTSRAIWRWNSWLLTKLHGPLYVMMEVCGAGETRVSQGVLGGRLIPKSKLYPLLESVCRYSSFWKWLGNPFIYRQFATAHYLTAHCARYNHSYIRASTRIGCTPWVVSWFQIRVGSTIFNMNNHTWRRFRYYCWFSSCAVGISIWWEIFRYKECHPFLHSANAFHNQRPKLMALSILWNNIQLKVTQYIIIAFTQAALRRIYCSYYLIYIQTSSTWAHLHIVSLPSKPAAIPNLHPSNIDSTITKIASGGFLAAAVTSSHDIYVWGSPDPATSRPVIPDLSGSQ